MPQRKFESSISTAFALVAALGLGLGACHAGDDDVSPGDARSQEGAQLQGTMIEIIPAQPLDQQTLHAVATQFETSAQAERAKVMLREDGEGSQHLEVELWATDALTEATIEEVRAQFPALADATITHAVLDGPPTDGAEGGGPMELDKDMSVEEVKAKVEADLRAQGVEGEVHVEVTDKDGERQVEVRVEKHKSESE